MKQSAVECTPSRKLPGAFAGLSRSANFFFTGGGAPPPPRTDADTSPRIRSPRRRVAAGACLITAALVSQACNPKPPETKDYVTKIAGERTNKDAMFQNGDDPVPKAKHAEFLPLSYFPIDPEYDVP